MHGLLVERFLKWFGEDISRWHKSTAATEMESEIDSDEKIADRSDSPEDKETRGKEELEDSEEMLEIT